MKQDKADKIIQKAERKAAKAAKQVEAAGKKAEAAKQKSAQKAEKKAAQVAKRAEQMAAKHSKKAEQATKKAQLAAQKAEEKKAKAAAKTAAKALEGEAGEADGKKKGKKKKLLFILLPVLAVAVGGGAFFFLKGGGEKEKEPLEPIPIPMEYVLNESHITALPVSGSTVLVYQEEIPPEPATAPADEQDKETGGASGEEGEAAGETGEEGEAAGEEEQTAAEPAEEEPGFTKILYRYEGLQDPVSLVSAYAAVMTTKDAGFSLVDETLLRIDPPEEELGPQGSLLLARNAPQTEGGTGGGVHSLLLSWEGTNCSVTLDMPEGRVHDPKPETPSSAAPRRGLSDLKALHPSKLGLPGESMDTYKLIPQEGSFRIAGAISTRVNIYGADNQFVGSYFLSADGKLYKLDEEVNGVVELDWE